MFGTCGYFMKCSTSRTLCDELCQSDILYELEIRKVQAVSQSHLSFFFLSFLEEKLVVTWTVCDLEPE